MKIRDLINAVDRSKQNTTSADIDEFCTALDINQYPGWNNEFDEKLKGYWLIKWLCTDTWVGYVVYYLDDQPVAVSIQTARKSSAEYEFVSLEAATKVRKFILDCLGDAEFTPCIADLDGETDPYYTTSYSNQLLVDKGWYHGSQVYVQRKCYNYNDHELKFNEAMVSYNADLSEPFKINMSDFKIPMHLNDTIPQEILQ